ncbi:uncharacterized protein LOC105645414 [Jatropha curcas]|uniref:uncharacterized protein LOC105645414 n=1 Tax=Jatropha curcas TaxID=180498 RepID=UPI0005FC1A9D|nr:uncharacterized protein LOC105645414 [Jatropha curcas]
MAESVKYTAMLPRKAENSKWPGFNYLARIDLKLGCFMRRRSCGVQPLIFDPEIEKTCQRNNAVRREGEREQADMADNIDDLFHQEEHQMLQHQLNQHNQNQNQRPRPPVAPDAVAGGSFERKGIDEAYDLIEEMESHSHYQNTSERKKPVGVYKIDVIIILNAKVNNMNGKQLEDPSRKEVDKQEEEKKKIPIIDLEEKEEVKPYVPPIPFPQRLKQSNDKSFLNFFDVLKKLQINIYFPEALAEMPSYAKFLKEILSKKRKINDQGMMLGMGELKPTRMSLQLANRSIKYLRGIVEDVLINIDEDREGSLILGKPFLATARALIDVYEGKLTLRVGQEEFVFDVLKSCKLPMDYNDCFRIDVINDCVKDTLHVKEKLTTDKGDINIDIENIKSEKESEPPKQELKQLSSYLNYAFLGENNSYLVIISSKLSLDQEKRLLQVLGKHRKALG